MDKHRGDLFFRISRRYSMTVNNWKNDCSFSYSLAVMRLLGDIGGRLGFRRGARSMNTKKEAWILNYLERELEGVFEQFRDDVNIGEYTPNAPIWICWWAGEHSAPTLVKRCIESIYANCGDHPVRLITDKNYREYLSIPEYIMARFDTGKMGTAHFADYLRVCLLEQYGGLWLDATMFCSQPVSESCFEMPFFTCKSDAKKGSYLSDFQWVTFCLGGWKHHVFYRFMKDAFEHYWEKEQKAIDYLFFDDIIYLAKKHIPAIQEAMESVPVNNIHRDDLQAAMNEALPENEFWNVIQKDTGLYKLSWRESYLEKLPDGTRTVFGYFLNRSCC